MSPHCGAWIYRTGPERIPAALIVFDESIASGNENQISSLRFYTDAQLQHLLVK